MKKILIILAGLLVVLIIALGVFISTFDINQYKGEMVKLVEKNTGRKFEVAGDLALGISLIPTVKVEEVKLGNADWGTEPDMISVKHFEVELGLIPLLSGNVRINQLVLDSAEILLETNNQGKGNWEFKAAEPVDKKKPQVEEGTKATPAVNINEVNIKNSRLTYKDGVKGKTTSVIVKQFVLEGGTFSSSMDVLLDAVYNEVPINMEGSLGSIESLTNNKSFPIDIEATVGNAELVLKGKIAEPLSVKGLDLDLSFNADTFEPFEKIIEKKLPALGAVQINGHIAEKNGIYTLKALNADLLNSQVLLNGKLSAENPARDLDLEFKLDTALLSNFNPLENYTGRKFPEIGPLNAKGKISEKEGFYLLEMVKANLGNDLVSVDGKLSTEDPAQGFDLDITINTETLSKYSTIAGQELPNTGPLQVAGKVSEKDGVYFFNSVNATMGKTSLTVNGKITDVKKAQGSDLNINFNAASLADLNQVTGSELPSIGPISLIAHVSDNKGAYQLKNMKFNADKTDLTGDFNIDMTGKRPAVIATLNSNLIDLIPFTQKKDTKESTKEKPRAEKVFSSDPLPFETLKTADAKLDINAKKLKTADLEMDNVKLVMSLNNGQLSLKPLNANVAGGSVKVDLDLNASDGKSAAFKTIINVKDFQPSSLPDLKDKLTGGKTDMDIDVKGSGASTAAIMAGLNGKFLMKIGAGTLESSSGDKATSDIFVSAFSAIYPDSGTSKNKTEIKCGVVNLDIKDGIATADKGIAFDTRKMNIIGSGIINLKTEELDIGIDPQAREGIGISAGQLAELVRIGGTLAEPKAVPDTKAALKTAASVGAAVATGGLSILAQGLFDRTTADSDPCNTALGIAPAKKAEPKQTTTQKTTETTSSQEDKNVGDKAVDTVKDAGSAIKDTFKGLFD